MRFDEMSQVETDDSQETNNLLREILAVLERILTVLDVR